MAVGHLLGVSGDAALALSLAKRMSEGLYGVPALLSWQWVESKALRSPAPSTTIGPR